MVSSKYVQQLFFKFKKLLKEILITVFANGKTKEHEVVEKQKTNYIFHLDNEDCFSNSKEDNLNLEVEKYPKTRHSSRFKCVIEFWKAYEYISKIIMSC